MEDLSIDGRVILKWVLQKALEAVDGIGPSEEKWWAVLNTDMNLRVAENMGYLLAGGESLHFKDWTERNHG
jgi:hypothetical protein